MIDGNCEKDIIRMVVNEDKFYRKYSYVKDRFEKDYVNYDQSGNTI